MGVQQFPSADDISPWLTYTPVLGATSTNPTMGAGATTTGRYKVKGKIVHCIITIAFGAGMTAGNGQYVITLPIPVSAVFTQYSALGLGRIYDSSANASAVVVGYGFGADMTRVQMLSDGIAGQTTNAFPWTWAVSDEIRLNLTYEAA